MEALAKVSENGSFVIPTKVGIQSFQLLMNFLGSRFHGNDDFLQEAQWLNAFALFRNDKEGWVSLWLRE